VSKFDLSEIEFMANVHKQISEKVDVSKPLPQEITVNVPMNLITTKRRYCFEMRANETPC